MNISINLNKDPDFWESLVRIVLLFITCIVVYTVLHSCKPASDLRIGEKYEEKVILGPKNKRR